MPGLNPIPETRAILKNIPRKQPNHLVIHESMPGQFMVRVEQVLCPEVMGEASVSPSYQTICEIILLTLFTGFRFNEARCLKWECVDLEHGII